MTRSINATTLVSYVAEVTPGTTPATPAFTQFRATGENLTAEIEHADVQELNGKRGLAAAVPVRKGGSGSVEAEITAATLEDFIEAGLRGTWAANVVTSGNTDKSFTLETKFETGGTDIYKRLKGARVDSIALKFAAAAKLSASVSFVAMDSDFASAAIAGATYTGGNSEPVQVGANVGAPVFTGQTFGVCTALDLTIKNNAKALYTLNGSLAATDVTVGTLDVTGSATFVLSAAEAALLSAVLAGTESGLTFTVGATANKKLTFEIPRLVFKSPKVASTSPEGDTMLTLDFAGLQASTISNEVIRITRLVA